MKKLLGIFVILALLIVLFSCRSDSEKQHKAYLDSEIQTSADFYQYINNITFATTKGVLTFRLTIRNAENEIVEVRYGAAAVIKESRYNYHLLTPSQLTILDNSLTATYDFQNYLGNWISGGDVVYTNATLGLSIIQIIRRDNLLTLPIASFSPRVGELVSLVGYQRQQENAISLGIVKEIYESIYCVEIDTDAYGIGAVLLNLNHEIIGIQSAYQAEYGIFITRKSILEFLDLFEKDAS